MLNAIRTTIDRELSKRTREFFPACVRRKCWSSVKRIGGSSKNNGSFLAKFEFLTPKDLEAAVITSEEHRLGTTSR